MHANDTKEKLVLNTLHTENLLSGRAISKSCRVKGVGDDSYPNQCYNNHSVCCE